MDENVDIKEEAYIDDTLEENNSIEDSLDKDAIASIDEEAESVHGDTDEDNSHEEVTPEIQEEEEILPVFEREDWQERVDTFAEEYPVAVELFPKIGERILEDDHLWNDEKCLEKALIMELSNGYATDEERAQDEEFLANYIYNNEAIRTKIVDEYIDDIVGHRPPSTMTKGGKISLTKPSRPTSIKEAGILAERIMRR